MEKYEPNSNAYKKKQEAEKERTPKEKVISGTAKVKKKSELRKAASNFISEDARNIKSYLLGDIVVPWVKDLIVDIVTDGINLLIHGERSHGTHKKKNGVYIDYSGVSKKSSRDRRSSSRDDVKVRQRYSFDDIYLETRREAEDVLNMMEDHIEQYDDVSVADLYDFVGVTRDWTDNKYGWTNLRSADVLRTRDGYLLKLPDAKPLD